MKNKTTHNPFIWCAVVTLTVIALLAGGCQSLFRGTITLTAAVDSAAKEYATLYKNGFVSTALDAKVEVVHAKYREAAGTAQDALVAYKLSGDPLKYTAAFDAARKAAGEFLTLIWPLLDANKATSLQKQINTAEAL